MKTLIDVMMKLIKSEICESGLDASVGEYLTEERLAQLYALSKKHDLAHIVGSALDEAGLLPKEGEIAAQFRLQSYTAVFRHERMKHEYARICNTLEEAEIDFMPLKGSVIRSLYPKPWQRTSCDIDVLVHEETLDRAVKALCERLGFVAEEERSYHDISLCSPNKIHLELHFNIKEHMEHIDALLTRVWEFAQPIEGAKFAYRQTAEYLVFHNLAHMSYHFVHGGSGLRPLIDYYLMRTKMTYDAETVREYCRQCKIETFLDRVEELVDVLFEEAEHNDMTLKMLVYLISGGVYGTQANHIAMQQSRSGSKLGFFWHRIFMPYNDLKILYPVLERHPWLTPICWVRRWIRILRRGRLKESVDELKAARGVTEDHSRAIGELLRELELN